MRRENTSVTNAVNAMPDQVGHVGEVDHPELIRPASGKVAVHVVLRPQRRSISLGGDELLPAANPAQTLGPHEPFDRAPGHRGAFAAQQVPHLPHPADPAAKLPAPEDRLISAISCSSRSALAEAGRFLKA